MSLQICPIQDMCPKYQNGTELKDHFVRITHACNDFLAVNCSMAVQLEYFLSDEPIACNISKVRQAKEQLS